MTESNSVPNFINWIVVLLTAFVGFVVAMIVALVAELFSLGHWFLAAIVIVVIVGLLVLEKLFDAIFDPVFNRIFRIPRDDREEPRFDHRMSRYAFVAGFVLAILASWIWSVDQIMDLI